MHCSVVGNENGVPVAMALAWKATTAMARIFMVRRNVAAATAMAAIGARPRAGMSRGLVDRSVKGKW